MRLFKATLLVIPENPILEAIFKDADLTLILY